VHSYGGSHRYSDFHYRPPPENGLHDEEKQQQQQQQQQQHHQQPSTLPTNSVSTDSTSASISSTTPKTSNATYLNNIALNLQSVQLDRQLHPWSYRTWPAIQPARTTVIPTPSASTPNIVSKVLRA
jgi:hypothetical protein